MSPSALWSMSEMMLAANPLRMEKVRTSQYGCEWRAGRRKSHVSRPTVSRLYGIIVKPLFKLVNKFMAAFSCLLVAKIRKKMNNNRKMTNKIIKLAQKSKKGAEPAVPLLI